MSAFRTHYDNLQVSRKASEGVIRAAYKNLSQKWHPDKHPHNRAEAEQNIRLINKAYEVLSDPLERNKHDQWIEVMIRKHYQDLCRLHNKQNPARKNPGGNYGENQDRQEQGAYQPGLSQQSSDTVDAGQNNNTIKDISDNQPGQIIYITV